MLNPTNVTLLSQQRDLYLAGQIEHNDYYLWLTDFIGLRDELIPVPNERILNSIDKHLNDIPLRHWDGAHPMVSELARSKGIPWALSDTVCCLKAAARRRAKLSQQPNPPKGQDTP